MADVRLTLREFVDGLAPMETRFAPIEAAMREAAPADPDVRRIQALHRRMRRDGYAPILDILTSKHPLRAGVDKARALDVIVFLAGEDTFRALVLDAGWSHDDWAAWVLDAVARLAFDA